MDRPVVYLYNHTTFTRGNFSDSGGIQTHNPSKQATKRLRLEPQGHRDQLTSQLSLQFIFLGATVPGGQGTPHYQVFTITLSHTTLIIILLSRYSARCRDLYL